MIWTASDFLSDFDALKSFKGVFETVENIDGAIYPAICKDISRAIKQDLLNSVQEQTGFTITPNHVFIRRFEEGSSEPYQAHTDLNMGHFTCIVYKQGVGGTAFLEHKETGVRANLPEFSETWKRDCNKYDAWDIYHLVDLEPNKALIYDAALMHRGEPVEGYGKGESSRELLICFFTPSILQRTYDKESIAEILTHPEIWERIGGSDDMELDFPMEEDTHYLLGDGALFILHPEGDDWMIHANVLPESRENAFEMGQEALRYGFEVIGADKIIASIPEKYINVYKFAIKSGMKEESVISGSHLMSLRYKEWASSIG